MTKIQNLIIFIIGEETELQKFLFITEENAEQSCQFERVLQFLTKAVLTHNDTTKYLHKILQKFVFKQKLAHE